MMSKHARDDDTKSTAPSRTEHDGRSIELVGNRLDTRDLFVSTREIIIGHGEESYRLRLTSQNKLILTK